MEMVLIDTSEEWVAIIVGEELILKVLTSRLRKKFAGVVHMRELDMGQKFSVLRMFNKIFSETGVRLYSLKPKANNWWRELIKDIIKRKINTLYVDLEVVEELRRKVPPLYLRQLNIYSDKETVQCADILAYGDSHRKLVKNIWKDVSIERGEPQVE